MSNKNQNSGYLSVVSVVALIAAIAIQIIEKNGIIGDENGSRIFLTPFGIVGIVCMLLSIVCAIFSRDKVPSKVILCIQGIIIVISTIGFIAFQMM